MEKIILFFVVLMVINGIGATFMSKAAILKGYGEDCHAWALCFCLGIFGYLYIIALPDKIIQSQNQQIIEMMKGREQHETMS